MDPIILSIIYLIGFIFSVIIYIWMSKYFDIRQTLSYIPGPKTYPFIGLFWQTRRVPRKNQFKWFNDLCFSFKDGIVVTWFGTKPIVNIRKPRQMETILSISSFINKMGRYKILTPWLGNGVLTSTENTWFNRRRFIKSGFHSNILKKYMNVMLEKVEILITCIHTELEFDQNRTINIFNLIYKYTADTICQIALGIDIDTQRNKNNEYVVALQRLDKILTNLYSQSWIKWNFVFHRTDIGKNFLNAIKIMHDFTEKVILQKQVDKKRNKLVFMEEVNELGRNNEVSFVDMLLDKCENTETSFTLHEIQEEINTFIFAGHNTTSSAINWSLFILGNNQDVQLKVQQELKQNLMTKNEPIIIEKLEQLQYFDRVIKEILRLYPSVPSIDRTLENDAVIDNYFIPKGTVVRLQIYQLHHDPEIWDDPETFNPDRFIPENCIGRHPYAYIPFSDGVRNCIGQEFALLQIKITLIAILQKWHISSILKPSEVKIVVKFNLKPYNEDIQLYFTPISI